MSNRQLQQYRGRENVDPTVVESFTENVIYARPVVGFFNFVKLVVGLGLLGAGAYGVSLIHDRFVSMVGQIANLLFICVEAIIIVAVIALIAIIGRFAVDFVLRFKLVDPGETGKHAYIFGKWIALHPLDKQAPKNAQQNNAANAPGSVNVEETVPTLAQLLEQQIIKPGISHMLFCYERDKKKKTISPLWGIWDDLKSFGIIGKPRKGKTNTLFFYIVQMILARAKVYICDKHSGKKSGLLKMLKPLRKWYKYANIPPDIIKTFQTFAGELDRRQVPLPDDAPEVEYDKDVWVLIVDEWNGVVEQVRAYDERHGTEYTDYIVKTATTLLREAAGYGMFIGLVIHAVTEYEIGSVPLRNNIHGVVCHNMEQGYSKFFFHDRKDNSRTPKLKLGEVLFKNAETSEIAQGEIPLCTVEDAITIAGLLEELDALESGYEDNQEYLPGTVDAPRIPGKKLPEQIAQHSTAGTTSASNILQFGSRPEVNQETRQEVAGSGFTMSEGQQLSQAQIEFLREIGKLAKKGNNLTQIRKQLAPQVPDGRASQELNAAIDFAKQYGIPEETEVETEKLTPEVTNE
jgi:hypothetical protein